MTTWNAHQYLLFADERIRPSRDLADRVFLEKVETAVDLGCGAGSSTMVIAERWPGAKLVGLDSSEDMIAVARKTSDRVDWVVSDIARWADSETRRFDLVFSNAALQWVPDHAVIYPKLFARVEDGGALAIQRPINIDAPVHKANRELSASSKWRHRFIGHAQQWRDYEPAFYYDLLSSAGARIDMWQTDYFHVMKDAESVVEWFKGSGLRPTLDALAEADRNEFLTDYLEIIRTLFPIRADGRVLFPMNRSFLIAYR